MDSYYFNSVGNLTGHETPVRFSGQFRACLGGTQSLRQSSRFCSTPMNKRDHSLDQGYYTSLCTTPSTSVSSEDSDLNTSLTVNDMISNLLKDPSQTEETQIKPLYSEEINNTENNVMDNAGIAQNSTKYKDLLQKILVIQNQQTNEKICSAFQPGLVDNKVLNDQLSLQILNNLLLESVLATDLTLKQFNKSFQPVPQISSTSLLDLQNSHSSSQNLNIEAAALIYRNAAGNISNSTTSKCIWSGRLPPRNYKMTSLSRKVFIGGLPWDANNETILMTFSRFGNLNVVWPTKELGLSPNYRKSNQPRGYCYLIFDHENSVQELLAQCYSDPTTGGDYYNVKDGSNFLEKQVQVIPWILSDSLYRKPLTQKLETPYSVFIGALHGMITAEILARIFNELFGNVVLSSIDTDKYKYPIGSGRVMFSNEVSYLRAVKANFVIVQTDTFKKTLQIDPYLEDSNCCKCKTLPGIYFCRSFECFNYFCNNCWNMWHNTEQTIRSHMPLRRSNRNGNCQK